MAPTEKKPLRVLLTGYGVSVWSGIISSLRIGLGCRCSILERPMLPQLSTGRSHPTIMRILTRVHYQPFSRTPHNPSWLAVKDLNGTYLHPQASESTSHLPPIHLTSFEIPVVYSSVLTIVPSLHARPPRLPPPEELVTPMQDPGLPVPQDGYDFIMHVGLGRKGGLSIERRGRKEGYFIKDVDGELAPAISTPISTNSRALSEKMREDIQSEAVRFEAQRVSGAAAQAPSVSTDPPVRRGFGNKYEDFEDELWTNLDAEELITYLKESGTEVWVSSRLARGLADHLALGSIERQNVVSSTDAGLYLCEFINYCALAESRRHQRPSSDHSTEVLFVHCPPIGGDLSLEEITKGLCQIVEYVCWKSGALVANGRRGGKA